MLRSSLYSLLPFLLTLVPSANADGFEGELKTSNIGCSLKGVSSTEGYSANFYSYTYNDASDYTNSNFYIDGGYTAAGLIGTASAVDPNFDYNAAVSTTATSSIWGISDFPITNFAAEFYGYFLASSTGLYTFQINHADESAMVFIGAGGLDCCNPSIKDLGTANEAVMLATKSWDSSSTVQESWVYLEAGAYYPIKIIYINVVSQGRLSFQITSPDGTDVSNDVFQLLGTPEANDCSSVYASVTESWTTYTFFDTNLVPGTTVFSPSYFTSDGTVFTYVHETIGVESFYTVTSTSYWSLTETSSGFSTVYMNDAGEVISWEFLPALSTSTSTWNQQYDAFSTFSDATTTYVVEYEAPLKTSYIQWAKTGYSTTTVTSAQNTYVEEYGPSLSVSYSYVAPGNNIYTETQAIAVSSDATTTYYSDILVVALPEESTKTLTWTKPGTTTFTSTWTPSGASIASEQVIVEEPQGTTIYVQDSTAFTVTSDNVVTTNAAGETITEDVVYVHQDLQTIYSFNSEFTATKTFTSTGFNADWVAGTYVYVDGPAVTDFVTKEANVWEAVTSYSWIASGAGEGAGEGAGYWEGFVYVPYYTTTYIQWDKSYTTDYVSETYFDGYTHTYNYLYVPSYSVSYSYWQKDYAETVTEEKYITYSLGIITSTYIYVNAPQPNTVTSTWEENYSTTYTTYATFYSDDEYFTSSEIIVEVPATNAVKSWITSDITVTNCDASAVSTTISTTVIGGVTTSIGYQFNTVPIDTCYLPPSSSSIVESSSSLAPSSSLDPTDRYITLTTAGLSCTTSTVTKLVTLTTSTSGKASVVTSSAVIVYTPAASCEALSTSTSIDTTGCGSTTATSTVTAALTATAGVSSGKVTGSTTYVLVVEETPAASCKALSTSTSIDTTGCGSTTATSTVTAALTATAGVSSGKVTGSTTYVLVVEETPAASCKALSTSTSIDTTGCGSTTATSTVTAALTATAGVSSGKVTGSTTYVLVVEETPAASCKALSTSTSIDTTGCGSTTATSTVTAALTATAGVSSGKVTGSTTYVLVVEETPAASCKALSTSTSIDTTGCGSTTATSTVTAALTATAGVSSGKVTGSTTYVLVVEETPAASCKALSTSTSIDTTGCGSTTATSTVTAALTATAGVSSGKVTGSTTYVLVVEETPAASCKALSTSTSIDTTGCGSTTATSTVTAALTATAGVSSGKVTGSTTYVLVVEETPAASCKALSTSTSIDTTGCGSTTATSTVTAALTATAGVSSGKVTGSTTYVLVVEETPAASCKALSTSTSIDTTGCGSTTATSTVTAALTATAGVSSGKVTGSTTYVLVVEETPAAMCHSVITSTITSLFSSCGAVSTVTSTSTSTVSGSMIDEYVFVVIESPAPSACYSSLDPTYRYITLTTPATGSACVTSTGTSLLTTTVAGSNGVSSTVTVDAVIVYTPAASCEALSTSTSIDTTGCGSTTTTSTVTAALTATAGVSSGKVTGSTTYVLVVEETPAASCKALSTSTSIDTTGCGSTTATSTVTAALTATAGVSSGKVTGSTTYVLVVEETPAASCKALSTSTSIDTTGCGSTTATSTVTAALTATAGVSSGKVTGSTTYVLVVEETPAASCKALSTSTSIDTTGCGSTTATSTVTAALTATAGVSSGKVTGSTTYVLVVEETPAASCKALSTSTSIDTTGCGSTTATSTVTAALTATAGVSSGKVTGSTTYVLVVEETPAASCKALSTSTSIDTTGCGSTTATSTVTAALTATAGVSSGKVTGSTTYVLVVEETPAAMCHSVITSTITSLFSSCGAVSTVTSTSTSTVSGSMIDEYVFVVIESPAPSACYSSLDPTYRYITLTTPATGSACVTSTGTSLLTTTVAGSNGVSSTVTVDAVIVYTPAASCFANVRTITEAAVDCELTSYTTNYGTFTDGRYVNATLVVVESPAATCSNIPTLTTIIPAFNCEKTSLTKYVSTTNVYGSAIYALEIIIETPASSCASESTSVAADYFYITTTSVGTVCQSSTVTSYSTATAVDGKKAIYENIVVVEPASSCAVKPEYTTYTTVSDDVTMTVTEPCSESNSATPNYTTYTTVSDDVTMTVTEPCSESNSATPNYTTYTTVSDDVTMTVTEPCSESNSATPNYTTYTTVSDDVTMTVTEPCSETNDASTEAPATTTEAPATTTEAPAATTEAPATTTEAPAATTEAPAAKTDTSAAPNYTTYTTAVDNTIITVTEPCSETNEPVTSMASTSSEAAVTSSIPEQTTSATFTTSFTPQSSEEPSLSVYDGGANKRALGLAPVVLMIIGFVL